MKIRVVVSLEHEAVHQWKDCPLEDVTFLKSPHRHMFHILAKKDVSHEEREIEIILLKRGIKWHMELQYPSHIVSQDSCETIARKLMERFGLSYCQVLEDGENGAEIEA